MNVASLELCRELYQLSNWGHDLTAESIDIWGVTDDKKSAVITQMKPNVTIGIPRELVPAYNLGYLIRKLPGFVHISVAAMGNNGARNYRVEVNRWSDSKHLGHAIAMAPEDAAALVAIEATCHVTAQSPRENVI